ncbi:hypothetical protein WAK64_10835 [Bacillus spongiae]|uniref:Uncharacterized protein n=1 Tax=Bacillus spongiae TaxID=2683610 RepID=A0ABU8HDV8_9BACI
MVLRIVPTMFPMTQDAINASTDGDSIKILAGIFDGFNASYRNNLNIFGCGIGKTIIESIPGVGTTGIQSSVSYLPSTKALS